MKNTYYLLFAAFLFSVNTFAQQPRNIAPGELLVSVIDNNKITELTKDLRTIDGVPTHITVDRLLSKRMHAWLLKFDSKFNHEIILDAVKAHPQTLIAQYNHTGVSVRATLPNEPKFDTHIWHHVNDGSYASGKATNDADIDSELAWDISTGGPTADGDIVVIANVDGGKIGDHEDIQMWHNTQEIPDNGIDDDNNGYIDDYEGWNSTTHNDSVTLDGHASKCSGIAAAIGNNGKGAVGVNWDAQIMPIEALWASSSTPDNEKEAYVVEGYGYALDMRARYNETDGDSGAFVVTTNASFGVNNGEAADFPLWCAMYDSMGAQGILSVGAATNYNTNVDYSGDMPTTCPNQHFIGVMCSDYKDLIPDDHPSFGKGYGPVSVDLAAPTGIYTLGTSGTSYSTSVKATSFSAPVVTGAISLLVSGMCPMLLADYKAYPDSILKMMKQWILDGADAKSAFTGKNVTGGRLNIYNMMQSMDTHCTTLSNGARTYGEVEVKGVFPNPATDRLNVNIGNENLRNAEVRITSLLGQIVFSEKYNEVRRSTNIKLDVNDLTPGYYFVTVRDELGNEVVQQFVKQ